MKLKSKKLLPVCGAECCECGVAGGSSSNPLYCLVGGSSGACSKGTWQGPKEEGVAVVAAAAAAFVSSFEA